MGNPRQAEIAYAAGIWDGEGSCAAYLGGGKYRRALVFNVSVWNNDERLLYWLQERFEGGVYLRKNTAFEWRVNGSKAYNFLKQVYPYLIVRRTSAVMMSKVWKSRLDRPLLVDALQARAAAETERRGRRKKTDATVRPAGQSAEVGRNDQPLQSEVTT
jgi:hypothetical protein